ncbi:MAG: hypothetical protein Q9162_002759 [Coniocarpon cinnabarinum]
MATAEGQDGAEHVTDFLKRIKELGEQRDQEDLERTRRLEEQVYEARRQREERRKERARSLSPEKHASITPRPLPSPHPDLSSSPLGRPQPLESLGHALESKSDSLPSSNNTNTPPKNSALEPNKPQVNSKSATTLARAKTLSWQQRPTGPRARPAAFLEKREPAKPASQVMKNEDNDGEPTKTDIAKSLASKGPTWFRQTADRAAGSAALRQSGSESAESTPSSKRQLHGLSVGRETPERDDSLLRSSATPTSQSPSLIGSMRGRPTASEDDSSIMSETIYESIEQPSEISSRGSVKGHYRSESESTVGRRTVEPTERSGSPTKGMGGFVQSAMLRRTDSVSRRWNVPTGGGLSRHNSSASYSDRPGSREHNTSFSSGMPRLDETNTFKRPASRDTNSRPVSAHNNVFTAPSAEDDSSLMPAPLSRSPSKVSTQDPREAVDGGVKSPDQSLRSSPSKRWSPTKSSWLESALSKPDTPRTKPPPPSQPAWMTDLQKNRQNRQSKDISKDLGNELGKDSGKDSGKDMGRTAPLWGGSLKSVSPVKQQAEKSVEQAETSPIKEPIETTAPTPKPKPPRLSRSPAPEDQKPEEIEGSAPDINEAEHASPQLSSEPGPIAEEPVPDADMKPATTEDRRDASPIKYPSQFDSKFQSRPKPDTPPKKDFRSQLKPRNDAPAKPQSNDVEFLNAAGKLRRADTKKYVAPDVLGDNIRRGKAGLTITGGPKARERRDSFKDSLIEQKQRMKDKAGESGVKPPVPEKRQASIPEALRKRQALGRNDNTANVGKPALENVDPRKQDAKLEPRESSSKDQGVTSSTSRASSPTKAPPAQQDVIATAPTVSAKLANRFNPAIANVLARGPPSPSPERKPRDPSPRGMSKTHSAPAQMSQSQSSSANKPLEHMTKGRARGPKRRLPKALEDQGTQEAGKETQSASRENTSPTASPRRAVGAKPAIRSSSRSVVVGGANVGAGSGSS